MSRRRFTRGHALGESQPNPRDRRCLRAIWLQAALAGMPELDLRAAPNNQRTQAYTSALAVGQSHLQQAQDPRLLALPNPYHPAKKAG